MNDAKPLTDEELEKYRPVNWLGDRVVIDRLLTAVIDRLIATIDADRERIRASEFKRAKANREVERLRSALLVVEEQAQDVSAEVERLKRKETTCSDAG